MAGLASLASKCRIESCLSSQNSSSFPFLSASGHHGSFCKHSSLRLLETAYSLFVGGGGGGVGWGGEERKLRLEHAKARDQTHTTEAT